MKKNTVPVWHCTDQRGGQNIRSRPGGHWFGAMITEGIDIMPRFVLPFMRAMIVVPLLQAAAQAASPNAQPTPPTPQMRTYVSGTGSDSNACIVTSPCKTFQAALALTIAGGEIYVLNSANYGAVTINKSVTITSEGAVAG